MEFIKIDENSFECLLTREDLDEYDITVEDFMKDRDKASDFVHKIVELGAEQIDFKPVDGGMVAMQISPLPDDGIRLILSTKTQLDSKDLLNMLKGLMLAEAGMQKTPDGANEAIPDINKLLEDFAKGSAGAPAKNNKKKAVKESFDKPRLYAFDKFSELERCIDALNFTGPLKSSLLYDDRDGAYYLLVERGNVDKLTYVRLCESFVEYGVYVTDNSARIAMITEHTRVIFASQAIKSIKEI